MLEGWGGLAAAAAAVLLLGCLWAWSRRSPGGSARRLPPGASRPRSDAGADEWGAARRAREPAPSGAAAEALLRVVRDELQRGHDEAAVAHWLALVAAGLDAHAEPALAIRVAAVLRDGGRTEAAVSALRAALHRSGGPNGLAVAARVARAATELDPHLAVDAAWRALASHELELLDRQDMERLIARLQRTEPIEPSEDARPPGAPAKAPEQSAEPARAPEAPVRPEPIELDHRPRRLEVALAVPVAIEPAGLRVALEGGAGRLVRWREIDAVAVGAVDGLGAKPVLVVDLVAGWRRPPEEPLRIVRLRGDRFDPRKVVEAASPVDALRELVDRLLGESGAEPLPDLRAARGRPFAGFRDLVAFEEDVLVAEEGGSAGRRA
jgi:hypothetical protein